MYNKNFSNSSLSIGVFFDSLFTTISKTSFLTFLKLVLGLDFAEDALE